MKNEQKVDRVNVEIDKPETGIGLNLEFITLVVTLAVFASTMLTIKFIINMVTAQW
jgi:hypothetical protein